MLNNASGFRKIYITSGYTDLRCGINGLASIVKFNFQLDPYEKDILFLFVADAVTVSRDSYGKVTGFFSFTKGWNLAVSAGPHKRRGAGNHTGTIPGIDAEAGDHLQTSNPGSTSAGPSVRYCAKRRK